MIYQWSFFKSSLTYVTPYVCKLFNLCIQHGVYPDNRKIAKVIPIHKKNARNNVANYRPISLQCNLGKIFECMFYNRISSFFQKFSPLTNHQFGFRKNKNTELATLHLLDKVLPAIEKNLMQSVYSWITKHVSIP